MFWRGIWEIGRKLLLASREIAHGNAQRSLYNSAVAQELTEDWRASSDLGSPSQSVSIWGTCASGRNMTCLTVNSIVPRGSRIVTITQWVMAARMRAACARSVSQSGTIFDSHFSQPVDRPYPFNEVYPVLIQCPLHHSPGRRLPERGYDNLDISVLQP